MSDKVPNRYRDELERALRSERFRAEATGGVLNTVRDAMANGAWQSTMGDEFARQCAEQQAKAALAADRTYEVLTSRLAREPVEVDAGDWRARFAG